MKISIMNKETQNDLIKMSDKYSCHRGLLELHIKFGFQESTIFTFSFSSADNTTQIEFDPIDVGQPPLCSITKIANELKELAIILDNNFIVVVDTADEAAAQYFLEHGNFSIMVLSKENN